MPRWHGVTRPTTFRVGARVLFVEHDNGRPLAQREGRIVKVLGGGRYLVEVADRTLTVDAARIAAVAAARS